MTTMTEELEILKTDVLGRVRMPADKREAILDEFERSGMSGAKFAERIGVKYQTFASWVQKRRRKRGQSGGSRSPSLALVEAVAGGPEQASETLMVELPGGAKVEMRGTEQAPAVAALIRELGKC
jgi:transposase-like protein